MEAWHVIHLVRHINIGIVDYILITMVNSRVQ
jgi:hypothetical protein